MLSSVMRAVNTIKNKIPNSCGSRLLFISTSRSTSTDNSEEQKINVKGLGINYVKIVLSEISRIHYASPTPFKERKISIRGVYINYLQVGCGEHPILLISGVLGTIWSSFKPQIENLDKPRFTIVAWDSPGYGKSRPPTRTFPDDYHHRDASFAKDLMNALGFKTFSVIGWSDGGVTACVLAAAYPNSVRKLIVLSSHSYITTEEINIIKGLQKLEDTSEKYLKETVMAIYGYDYVKTIWQSWIEAMVDKYEKRNGELCTNILGKIQCPTLIVHGDKDTFIKTSQAIFFRDRIQRSRMSIIEGGSHFLQLQSHEEFNKLVTEFLSPPLKLSKF